MLDRNFFQKISGSATENYIWVSNTMLSFRKKLKIIFWENLWTDRRLDRWVDGRTDGRTDGQTLFYRPKTGVQKYNMTQDNATVKNEIKRKKNGRKKKTWHNYWHITIYWIYEIFYIYMFGLWWLSSLDFNLLLYSEMKNFYQCFEFSWC